ncbi:unnamed protein product, partial [Closterium sp. NIES-53]
VDQTAQVGATRLAPSQVDPPGQPPKSAPSEVGAPPRSTSPVVDHKSKSAALQWPHACRPSLSTCAPKSAPPTAVGQPRSPHTRLSRLRPSEDGTNIQLPLTLPWRVHAWASTHTAALLGEKLVDVHTTHSTPSPHQPCRRAVM